MPETDLLSRYLASERDQKFTWGQGNGDCLLFLAGWGIMLNGIDFAADLRGTYSDEAGARAAIDRRGGAVAFVASVSGPERQEGQQERGDIGLLAFNGWHLGMICTGSMWAVRAGEGGIRFIRRPADFIWAPNARRQGQAA